MLDDTHIQSKIEEDRRRKGAHWEHGHAGRRPQKAHKALAVHVATEQGRQASRWQLRLDDRILLDQLRHLPLQSRLPFLQLSCSTSQEPCNSLNLAIDCMQGNDKE